MEKASVSECLTELPVCIMVVDDHPNIATTLARAISQIRTGIQVISASSGEQALKFADQQAIDILITDMMMPGMNGLELIESLQSHPAGRPVHIILMTAYDVPGLKETTRRLKVHDTIIKPVPTERICQIVKKVLDNMGGMKLPSQLSENPRHFKIMIADDIPDNVTLLSRYIKNEGYEYITASNGVEVLEKARLEMPDLILLDVNMPEKDGFAALEELRGDPEICHIPVIILTAARPNPGEIQKGLNLGADDYITKPFDKRELFARIRTRLRVKEAEDITRRRNRELGILPEIGKELSARLDINELADVVLHRVVETLGAMVGHIIILDPRGPIHKNYHISTPAAPAQEMRFPPLNDLISQIKETRQGLIINDIHSDPRWQGIPENPAHSITIVPMFGRLDLIGLLILTHEKIGYFKLEHQLLLQAIASQASIAVENAQLYERMAREQGRLAAVLQGAADAILLFDADGCLVLLNPAAQSLFKDSDVRPGLPLIRGSAYDALINTLEKISFAGTSATAELQWPDQRIFSTLFTPIEGGGWVVVLHDVTHFKKLEKVKNEFIATASHDLRNPITSIKGFSQLIEQAGPLNDYQDDFVKRIQNAADNMSELVDNMLDLAKMELDAKSSYEALDVSALLCEIADEFQPQARTKRQSLTLENSISDSQVWGDALGLRQALRNVIGNAVKYTPEGGTITLSPERELNSIKVRVRDSGYGIPADDLPFIFDRFYRVRNYDSVKDIEGNGLGLAIVKSIIEKHGGDISVESKVGQGTCFTLELPRYRSDTLSVDSEASTEFEICS
jgi:signal transduction histidine kinase/DNA-binding response OmpR family regulator